MTNTSSAFIMTLVSEGDSDEIQSIRVFAPYGLLTNDNFIFEYLNHVCNQLDE